MFPLLFVPGMTYSQSNYQTYSSFPCDSMNVFWNSKMMEMATRPMLYSYQSYDYNNFMPYQYNFGFDLLNPANFAQQWINQNQNMMGANWGGVPYLPGVGSSTSTGGSNGSSNKYTEAEKQEIKDLEAILKAHRDITKNAKRKSTINEALSAKYAEKLEALRKAFKAIPENDIKRTLMVMKDNKTSLENAGYTFGDDYSYRNTNDTDLINNIDAIHAEIVALEDNEYVSETYQGAIQSYDILRLISYWNDKYNKADERSIINLVFKKLPNGSEDKQHAFDANVVPLVKALTDKATEVIDSLEGDTSKIKEAKDKLIEAKDKGVSNKTNIVKAFENLYVLLRKAEAERINQELQDKYEFLNDIDENDTDIITDKLVIDDTEKDLAKEFKNNSAILTQNGINGSDNGDNNGGAAAGTDGNESSEVRTKAYDYGVQVSRCMTKKKSEAKNAATNEALSNVTEDNVVDFLDGLYSKKKRNYFRRMDKRSKEKFGEINFADRKNLMLCVLKAAEKAGISTGNSDYDKLKELYTAYTTGYKKDCTDFKEKSWFMGASDGRKIGRYIRRLYKEIKASEQIKKEEKTETKEA
ncbi:hypothetical protein IKB17_07410 [bacterium]|nr:hypothetical protein [bacterium]